VHALERSHEIRYQHMEWRVERGTARDQGIVEIVFGVDHLHVSDRRLKTPPDAISLDRVANLLRHRKAEPRAIRALRAIFDAAPPGFKHERRHCPARTLTDLLKIGAVFERCNAQAESFLT
jgi:hypothetical protein